MMVSAYRKLQTYFWLGVVSFIALLAGFVSFVDVAGGASVGELLIGLGVIGIIGFFYATRP